MIGLPWTSCCTCNRMPASSGGHEDRLAKENAATVDARFGALESDPRSSLLKVLRRLTALHRWLGLIIGLQVVAWSVGGVYFAWNDIRDVRGDSLRLEGPPPAMDLAGVRMISDPDVRSLRLIRRGDRLSWEVGNADGTHRYLDASTHEALSPLTEDGARKTIAREIRTVAGVSSTSWIAADPPLEYREKPLPAWCIELADGAGTRVYVDASSGAIAAIRSDSWRRWDFLWGLHIMDYRGRDDMHHPLLLGAAALAFLASTTGLLLWAGRLVVRIRRRHRPQAPA